MAGGFGGQGPELPARRLTPREVDRGETLSHEDRAAASSITHANMTLRATLETGFSNRGASLAPSSPPHQLHGRQQQRQLEAAAARRQHPNRAAALDWQSIEGFGRHASLFAAEGDTRLLRPVVGNQIGGAIASTSSRWPGCIPVTDRARGPAILPRCPGASGRKEK